MQRIYSSRSAENYISRLKDAEIYTIPGNFIGHCIVIHADAIELFEANGRFWKDAYTRHVYRKRVPKSLITWLASEMKQAEAVGSLELADALADAIDSVKTFFE